MEIEIHTHGLNLPEELRQRLDGRLRRMAQRLACGVRRVAVTLSDVNGPRGGLDKRCCVQVHLGRSTRRALVIQDTGASLPQLLDRTLLRTARTLARRTKRVLGVRRQGRAEAPGAAAP